MATLTESLCFTDAPPIAAEVARGVTRLFCRQDLFAVCEMPLPERPSRRSDGDQFKGCFTIVEIKVAKADLLGDGKVDRLSRLLRPFLLGSAPPSCADSRRRALSSSSCGPDRCRSLRRSDHPGGGASSSGAPRGGRPSCSASPAGLLGASRRKSTRRSGNLLSGRCRSGLRLLILDQLQDVACAGITLRIIAGRVARGMVGLVRGQRPGSAAL